MRLQSLLFILLPFLLLNSCEIKTPESITDKFYQDLRGQYEADHFSPVEFAEQFKPDNHITN